MPTIELSAGFMQNLPTRINRFGEISNTNNVTSTSGLLMQGQQSYGTPSSTIALMKGSVPSDLSSLTSYTVRSSDVLVSFSTHSLHFSPSQPTVNPSVYSTIYVNATQSGTATWFWWTVRPTYSLDGPNNIVHQIVGTVGLTGSGSDLELGDVNIVSGSPYRIINLRLSFQSSWVF